MLLVNRKVFRLFPQLVHVIQSHKFWKQLWSRRQLVIGSVTSDSQNIFETETTKWVFQFGLNLRTPSKRTFDDLIPTTCNNRQKMAMIINWFSLRWLDRCKTKSRRGNFLFMLQPGLVRTSQEVSYRNLKVMSLARFSWFYGNLVPISFPSEFIIRLLFYA